MLVKIKAYPHLDPYNYSSEVSIRVFSDPRFKSAIARRSQHSRLCPYYDPEFKNAMARRDRQSRLELKS